VGKKKWPGWQHQPAQARPVTALTQHSVSSLTLESSRFEGPLPPPTDLAQYEQVSPGFADRIVQMAEKEQDFRHLDIGNVRDMQRKIIGRGQVFGFILTLVIILGGILLIMSDKPTSGFIAILAGIATVAGPFFYSASREKKQQ
jgi:uncharacterized membrane protein